MVNIRNNSTKCLYDYDVSREYAVQIKKLEKGEKASIVSDTMFRTMFQNKNRLKYSVKLLSYILDISYEELIKKIRLYKNNPDKEYESDKNERCDYVAEIDESYVNIEVNNNSSKETMERNIEYINRMYSKEIEEGSEYKYNQVIQINLNNFSFDGNDKIIDMYGIQNEEGIMLTRNITFIQIYIPNIRKKWYTEGKESLSEMERYILILAEPNIDTVKDIGIGDDIMEEYLDESIKVCKNKTFGESYDKELAFKQQTKFYTQLDVAEKLANLGLDLNTISKATGLEMEVLKKQEIIPNIKEKIEKAKDMANHGFTLERISEVVGLSIETLISEGIDVQLSGSYDKEWALKDEWQRVGLQQGLEKGIEQGIEQGAKQEKIEIAKKMLKDGISIENISKYTNLTTQEIEKLK